mmetsp:Transcript_20534/g.17933  ORF Transcript_20534/g.17933 Transcript_20534/m.17933 type:complete len:110 (+) Transcript_20534:627-956(+)|eukprot:CAMPEP_0114581550 /NCGR_PEP_ID=MMETSP0125-20121206/5645_1 /TAXON_ID=485358 ORGANISM="Aristerostoma sp., Strain ATCC 50986" /NCGR_SAMPLE_ID=MMETSP0125 /ASSEMBLY_ACC=CAM_ASM_000245 /LENGTH=109 /DNA_ID=CAMNT_0001773843 /DNA_START=1228 /DNA_END=1557 /DNA_ORIENTATION=+
MNRVDKDQVFIQGDNKLDFNEKYTLITREYLLAGKDGYTDFKDLKFLIDPTYDEDFKALILRFLDLTKDPEVVDYYQRLAKATTGKDVDPLEVINEKKVVKKKSSTMRR